MKKKLCLLPVMILMLTMMLGSVCVFAETQVTKIKINITDPVEGETTGDFVNNKITVTSVTPDGETLTKSPYVGGAGGGASVIGDSITWFGQEKILQSSTNYILKLVIVPNNDYCFAGNGGDPNVYTGNISFSGNNCTLDHAAVDPLGSLQVIIKFTIPGDTPTPTPTPKKSKSTSKPIILPILETKEVVEEKPVIVNRDTFKSEAPSKTFMAYKNDKDAADMKVHAVNDTTKTNQRFLMSTLVGPGAKEILTTGIYAPCAGTGAYNGETRKLVWKDPSGSGVAGAAVYAVIYNQADGAYVLYGTYTDKYTAVFPGFIYRDASTITLVAK